MSEFFSIMTNVSTAIVFLFYIFFIVGIFINSKTISDVQLFRTCDKKIKACRIASVIFVVLNWFIVSGLSSSKCLAGYKNISLNCSYLGYIWIVFAVISLAISVIIEFLKKGIDETVIVRTMRNSSFIMGIIFLIIAFILQVN